MAKKKELSAIEMLDQVEQQVEANGADEQQSPTPTEIPRPNPPKEVEPVNIDVCVLSVPFAESLRKLPNRYLNLSLTFRQARALDQIREGADKSQARLRSGRRVVDTVGAVRYMLERIADSLGIPEVVPIDNDPEQVA